MEEGWIVKVNGVPVKDLGAGPPGVTHTLERIIVFPIKDLADIVKYGLTMGLGPKYDVTVHYIELPDLLISKRKEFSKKNGLGKLLPPSAEGK